MWSGSLKKSRCVAGHLVDFEIEPSARPQGAKRGDLKRVRNDQHRKCVARDLVHRKRDAVESDRAFGRNEA